jgi:uncharacterized protein
VNCIRVFVIAIALIVGVSFALAADFKDGQAAYDRCDYATALRIWRSLAEEGNAEAAYKLGLIYFMGTVAPETRDEAENWLRLAAQSYRKAAEKGDALAQFSLGKLYLAGDGVKQDYAEAQKWLQRAADQGNVDAIEKLGDLYNFGLGVTKNSTQALTLYRRAAETGDAQAQADLGIRLEGFEAGAIEQNFDEAAKWLRKAAEQGNASAQSNLSTAYFQGKGVPKSTEEELRWLQKAAGHEECDLVVENARYDLGVLNRSGGLEKEIIPNGREAVQWFEKAVECGGLGFGLPSHQLADMFKTGDGVVQDYEEAVKWLRIDAEAGAAYSQFDLAEMYRDGLGVPQDYVAAHMWFNLAARAEFWRLQAGGERDRLAAQMTNEQINEAQRLARKWQPKCGEEGVQVRALIQTDR